MAGIANALTKNKSYHMKALFDTSEAPDTT